MPALTLRDRLRRICVGTILAATGAGLLGFGLDYAVFRLRVATNRSPYGSVVVTHYTAIQKIISEKAVPLSAHICVFGSGGMAKAIISALDDLGYRTVTIVARNARTAGPLAEKYGYRWLHEISETEGYQALINASPVGMFPDTQSCPFSDVHIRHAELVIDSVANPVQTQLIRTAAALRRAYVTGFDITILQSVEQFHLYTGAVPEQATLNAAREFVQAAM